MGWASAGSIFDPVAQALVDLNAPPVVMRKVLGTLLDKLTAEDWDTTDESLDAFRSHIGVVQVFYEHGECNRISGADADGVLGYDPETDRWTLICDGGRDACGQLDTGNGGSADEHDRLVRLWATHEADKHGGDGSVADWMLINPDEVT